MYVFRLFLFLHCFITYSFCSACKSALVQIPMFSSFYFRAPSILSPPFFLSFFLSILHFLWQFLNVFTNSLFSGLVLSIVVPCVLWLTLSLTEGVIKKFRGFDATFFVNTELTYLLLKCMGKPILPSCFYVVHEFPSSSSITKVALKLGKSLIATSNL